MRYLSLFATHDNSLDLVILFVGQGIAALGQPLFINFPAVIAMEWFPVQQRDMATIIAAVSNLIGNAVGQVILWFLKGKRVGSLSRVGSPPPSLQLFQLQLVGG